MKLTKNYIEERLKNTSVQALAEELEKTTHVQGVDVLATIEKYKRMLTPLAPVKEILATDMLESMGIHVVRIS